MSKAKELILKVLERENLRLTKKAEKLNLDEEEIIAAPLKILKLRKDFSDKYLSGGELNLPKQEVTERLAAKEKELLKIAGKDYLKASSATQEAMLDRDDFRRELNNIKRILK